MRMLWRIWPRTGEQLTALWLIVTPLFLVDGAVGAPGWGHDVVVGALVIVFSLASVSRRFRGLQFVILPIALWLVGIGWWFEGEVGGPALTIHENRILVGFTLAMFAVMPTRPFEPPEGWSGSIARESRPPVHRRTAVD